MTTFAIIHGSGDGGWAWHLVQRALRERGHEAVAPDLPSDRDDATWDDCVDALVAAVGGADDVVVVGHSSGGFVVPLVADRLGATLQVFLAGMVPRPGERAGEWFGDVGWYETVAELALEDGGLTGNPDPMVAFYHDVPAALASQAMARERPISERLGETPWPMPTLPTIAARYVVTARDRFIPPPVQRRVAAERLGITAPDEIQAGHCAHLSRPERLAGLLAGYVDRAHGG
jgi:pimeloyl-ACP methyl ester carboxylesterase